MFALVSALIFLNGLAGDGAEMQRPAAVSSRCQMTSGDRRWLTNAIAKWPTVQERYLKSPIRARPTIVTYDSSCRYVLSSKVSVVSDAVAETYTEAVSLPNGANMPVGPNAFFTATTEGDQFLLFALPSVWASVAPRRAIPLSWMLEGMFFHEMAHAYESQVTPSTWFLALQQQGVPSDKLNDDSVQHMFESNEAYTQAVAAERDKLFAAAEARDNTSATRLACEAHRMILDRRNRFFAHDEHGSIERIDEISNTTEGLGQWLAYMWLTKERRISSSDALRALRSPFWSQDVGLAMFLTIDRLIPNWQRRLFSNPPKEGTAMLKEACKTPKR